MNLCDLVTLRQPCDASARHRLVSIINPWNSCLNCFGLNIPVGSIMVKDAATGPGGLCFDYRAGQSEHCRQRLATAAMFLCCPGATREMGLATRYTLWRNIASITKI